MKISVLSKLPFLLLVAMIGVLVVATFLEQTYGAAFTADHVYRTLGFRLLWGGVAVSGGWVVMRRRLWRKPAAFLFHLAFALILLGALATSLTSIGGTLHLRQGRAERLLLTDEESIHPLPFQVELLRFRILYYPGTSTPRDYESTLRVGQQTLLVSMNAIARHEGYRFYQSSYDTDEKGSLLTVNYDPYGIPLTYAGYLLLLLAILALMLSPRGDFRRLLRHPALRRSFAVVGFACFSFALSAALPVVPRAQADSFARRQVVYNDRVCPLNTLAVDFCKKLYGAPSFHSLTPEQVLLSWLFYPEAWQDVPMIRIKSADLRRELGVEGRYARLSQLYDRTTYRLQSLLLRSDPDESIARAVQEVDEQVALILMLHKGTLIRRIEGNPSAARLSERRVSVELLYNRLQPVKWLFMGQLIGALLAFVAGIAGCRRSWITKLLRGVLLTALFANVATFSARTYIGGYIALSNGFETMLFLSLSVLLVGALLMRRFPYALAFSLLLSGFSLLVAHLAEMNPRITPLMPVLDSPLLSLHVTLVMLSYALFALMALHSLYALILLRPRHSALSPRISARCEQLTVLNRLLLLPAVFLLSLGIFVGAVWANLSWGRYWGWDPKEVWALITMLIYSFALHPSLLPRFRRPRFFHLFLLLAFLSVLITYFGVNFFLGGRHAYA